ncbi:T9SS type A sorting domain-containing protein [Flavobacteriales bacterium]|nr:T9SS type A sorting domain-containing protein [Flavobacteriales bacterium]
MKALITALIISSISTFSFGQHPTNLNCPNITYNSAICEWTNNGCNNYFKYRALDSTSNGAWIITTSNISNPFLLNGLLPLTDYEWTVKCAGVSGWSNSSFFTTFDSTECLNTIITTNNSTCEGSYDGSASIDVFNGAPPYLYLWNNSNNTTSVLNNIPNDTYIVTTTDSTGCSKTDTILVGYDNSISLTQYITPFIDTTNPGFPNTVQSHNIWVFDTLRLLNNGCDINIRPEFSISHQDSAIQQGQIQIQWKSPFGFMTIPYIINNGDAFGFWSTASTDSTGINAGINSINEVILRVKFQNQAPYGSYSAIWNTKEVDLLGDIIQTVTENDTTTLTLVNCNSFIAYASDSNLTCWDGHNGSASIDSIMHGSGNYSYNWINNVNPAITLATTNNISNLSAANYSCTILDNNWSCLSTETFSLSQPTELISTLTTFNVSCNSLCDGEIISNTSGGILPYSYLWTNSQDTDTASNLCPGNYSLSVTDENGCVENISTTISEPNEILVSVDSTANITTYGGSDGYIYISLNGGSGLLSANWTSIDGFNATTEDIIALSSSTYFLHALDTNLCLYLDTFELTQPSSLWTNIDVVNNPSCYDSCNGSIQITVDGGDSTYFYSWQGPNGFTSNNDDISGLCYGEYIITINDGITNLLDTINIYQPQPMTTILSVDSIVCHNGTAQAEINVWGGTQPFTYNWSNGDSNYFTTISSGNHSIDISDINGCSISQLVSLSNPDSIFTQATSTNTDCFGGNNGTVSINIISGGTATYNFSNNNGITYQSSNTFNNLSAGNYAFLISDINGCLGSALIDVIEPPELTSITTVIDVSCYGECDGSVMAIASGGTPPYSYQWTNGTSNLCAGFYNVAITDTNGCINTNSAIVNEPNPLLLNIWIDGNNIVATSGFSSYQWYNNNNIPISGASNSIFTPTAIGIYYVTATNSDGCSSNSYVIDYNTSSLENYSLTTNIFPNPTNGKIIINSEYYIKSVSIYNSIGNQLLSVNNKGNKIPETQLDLSTFAKGIYFIKININNQIVNQKILLQ